MTTTRVSVANDGLERPGNSGVIFDIGGDGQLDISDDGRYVVFMSRAPLAPGDTASCDVPGRDAQLPRHLPARSHRRHHDAGQPRRRAAASRMAPATTRKMSGDGRWIVFESEATNLVPGDTNGVTDVFLFDRMTGAIYAGQRGAGRAQADLPSFAPAVSDDGNIIAFVSASTLLSTEPDTVTCQSAPPACLRPFVVDRQAGTTRRVPAPPIVTSRVVDTPGGPLTITYRVEASQVLRRARRRQHRGERQQHRQRDHELDRLQLGKLDLPPGAGPGHAARFRPALRELGRPPLDATTGSSRAR